jgi:hypothetical protein
MGFDTALPMWCQNQPPPGTLTLPRATRTRDWKPNPPPALGCHRQRPEERTMDWCTTALNQTLQPTSSQPANQPASQPASQPGSQPANLHPRVPAIRRATATMTGGRQHALLACTRTRTHIRPHSRRRGSPFPSKLGKLKRTLAHIAVVALMRARRGRFI